MEEHGGVGYAGLGPSALRRGGDGCRWEGVRLDLPSDEAGRSIWGGG